jgi:hypothetical protein
VRDEPLGHQLLHHKAPANARLDGKRHITGWLAAQPRAQQLPFSRRDAAAAGLPTLVTAVDQSRKAAAARLVDQGPTVNRQICSAGDRRAKTRV